MVEFPIDKYLAQDYRNTLRTFEAPQNIDTKNPVIPVIDIQKGFPKPNAKQTLKTYDLLRQNAASGDTQIATSSSTLKIYFVGALYNANGTNYTQASQSTIQDSTSGTPGTSLGATNNMGTFIGNANTMISLFPSLPRECIYGIRASVVAPTTGNTILTIYYIEEII